MSRLSYALKMFTTAFRKPIPGSGYDYPLDRKMCAQCVEKHLSAALAYLNTYSPKPSNRLGDVFKASGPLEHLGQALVLSTEMANGYPEFRDYIRGHLACAEDGFLSGRTSDFPERLAYVSRIRELRTGNNYTTEHIRDSLIDLLGLNAKMVNVNDLYIVGHLLEASSESGAFTPWKAQLALVVFSFMYRHSPRPSVALEVEHILRSVQSAFELQYLVDKPTIAEIVSRAGTVSNPKERTV